MTVVVCFISSTLAFLPQPQVPLSVGADLASYVSVSKCVSLKLAPLLFSFLLWYEMDIIDRQTASRSETAHVQCQSPQRWCSKSGVLCGPCRINKDSV